MVESKGIPEAAMELGVLQIQMGMSPKKWNHAMINHVVSLLVYTVVAPLSVNARDYCI